MYLLDSENNVHKIQEDDIICMESSRPHIYYRTPTGKYRAPRTLDDLIKIHSPKFLKIDKKKLVNLELADKFENGFIFFGNLMYAVSRRVSKKIKEIMDQKKPK